MYQEYSSWLELRGSVYQQPSSRPQLSERYARIVEAMEKVKDFAKIGIGYGMKVPGMGRIPAVIGPALAWTIADKIQKDAEKRAAAERAAEARERQAHREAARRGQDRTNDRINSRDFLGGYRDPPADRDRIGGRIA